jgi:hypothetical protein
MVKSGLAAQYASIVGPGELDACTETANTPSLDYKWRLSQGLAHADVAAVRSLISADRRQVYHSCHEFLVVLYKTMQRNNSAGEKCAYPRPSGHQGGNGQAARTFTTNAHVILFSSASEMGW